MYCNNTRNRRDFLEEPVSNCHAFMSHKILVVKWLRYSIAGSNGLREKSIKTKEMMQKSKLLEIGNTQTKIERVCVQLNNR